MIDLLNLRTLVEAAKLGSFTKAAVNLCVTQSAVSRRIKALEELFGEELLDRSGTALKLTAVGELVVEKAGFFFGLEKDLLDAIQALKKKRKISFCCTPPFGIAYLPHILKEFMASNSDNTELKFVFEMPERAMEGLKEKLFDLALIEYCEDLSFEGFAVLDLPDDEVVFVSSPKLGIDKDVVNIDDILPERLYSKKEGCCARRFLDKSMKNLGLDSSHFQRTLFFDDIPFIIREVIAGEGVTFISRSLVAEYLDSGALKAHHVEGFARGRRRCLVLHRRKPDLLMTHFIEGIFDAFGLTPPALYPGD